MADQFQTSFIPKKTIEETRRARSSSMGLIMFSASLVFVLSIAGAVGVYFYTGVVEGNIASKKEALARAQDAFEPSLIRELAELDARMVQARGLIESHIAPSGFFPILEQLTLEDVQFTNFSFGNTGEDGTINIQMAGIAKDFATIALQSDVMGDQDDIHNPLFTGLAVSEAGQVSFSFSGAIDPEIIMYSSDGASGIPAPTPVNTDPAPDLVPEPTEVPPTDPADGSDNFDETGTTTPPTP